AKRLWAASAEWVEQHREAVEVVDTVADRRANAVRLDARRGDVRLAPPMADAWAQWLAAGQGDPPFRGADVSLHAVAQMAKACVGALRRALGSTDALALTGDDVAGDRALDCVNERVRLLDAAIGAQDVRLARLRRLRKQLADQKAQTAPAAEHVPENNSAVDALLEAVHRRSVPLAAGAEPLVGPSRASELAEAWAGLLDDEAPPVHVVGLAWPDAGSALPRLSLSFMSDLGSVTSSSSVPRKRAPQPLLVSSSALKRQRPRDIDDVPDFLVD
ncbi:hypothetical protein GGI21_004061, partial [Coemansia aciculifera]